MLATADQTTQIQVLDSLKVKHLPNADRTFVNRILELATSAPEPVSRRAVFALGNMQADVASEVLIKILGDSSKGKGVRKNAATALMRIGES